MEGPIASAVVIPDPEPSPPPAASPLTTTAHKRRQSSTSDDATKRPRLTIDDAPADRQNPTKEPKAPVPVRRERGRERRLFGAALGALSQNSATAAQKRRSEIEKRQLTQRKLDEEESEQRKAERAARRKAQRWREHQRFERDAMRIRHESLVSMAHFLWTETEPRLHYKPWETTAEEDDRIHDQIADAHETVRRETEDYEARQAQETQRERRASRGGVENGHAMDTDKRDDIDASEHLLASNRGANGNGAPPEDDDMKDDHHAETPADDVVMEGHAAEPQQSSLQTHNAAVDAITQDTIDEMGEEIVEATEDTVIY
ncbi:hypothetical protein P153DRAFT_83038 [Dothidotthia symphoricarpi CBS 119687]|uniref:Pinin/SDK/MemA protein domain-containing protein n=1 Tax=Dothidotthia symphoricarpi CBS 119687 TaxID=1392245 RepID=A0A6A6A370_9PLEO|nr:uncharacterized protein P153DRAFT_83038 [Dothidotthia symphoricarpi CBS 119687]KAF2125996.1 hypothetical protein P153DRAFT_83038 [Dothidotthia symphoricarpi CBS 119687]